MNVLNVPEPAFMQEEEITLFSDSVGKWIDEHAAPEAVQSWLANSSVPRKLWNDAGDAGAAGMPSPPHPVGFADDPPPEGEGESQSVVRTPRPASASAPRRPSSS